MLRAAMGGLCLVLACGCSQGTPADGTGTASAPGTTSAAASAVALPGCSLLVAEEVSAVLGPLAGPPVPLAQEREDARESRCAWRSADGRELLIGGAIIGPTVPLERIEPYTAAAIEGDWEQARLEGCCTLHALRAPALVTIEFSQARVDLDRVARLMGSALRRARTLPGAQHAAPGR